MPDSSPTFSGPRPPFWARLLNGAGRALGSLGIRAPRLDLNSLLGDSEGASPLQSDPGEAAFVSRLSSLLQDAEGPANLHQIGRIVARRQFTRLLRNRLLLRQWLADHPETFRVPVERPLFVVGQARTGTTLLYNLLARDPQRRAPTLWEVARPIPPPNPALGDTDPRIREVDRELNSALSVIPDVLTAHSMGTREPEECFPLLETSAFSFTFLLYFDVPTYWSRLRHAPPAESKEAYGEYRRQVEILQTHTHHRRWLSKAPSHLIFLGDLLRTFPDGCVVLTHREPAESIPSLCSLISIVRSLYSDRIDRRAIGCSTLEWYLEAARRAEEARALTDPERLVDVPYPQLVADPIGTIRSIYHRLGDPVTPAFEEGMRVWLSRNPQHKHGVHRYSLEQFGLDADRIRTLTSDYRRQRLPG